jgi:hypothetical protein
MLNPVVQLSALLTHHILNIGTRCGVRGRAQV